MSMYMRSRISQRHRLTVRITHSSGLLHTPLLLPPFSLIVMLFIIIFNSILISHHSNCMYYYKYSIDDIILHISFTSYYDKQLRICI